LPLPPGDTKSSIVIGLSQKKTGILPEKSEFNVLEWGIGTSDTLCGGSSGTPERIRRA
jgi:hypothetical protein